MAKDKDALERVCGAGIGAMWGAKTGALAGLVAGPIGAAVGAKIGAIAGGVYGAYDPDGAAESAKRQHAVGKIVG